VRNIKITKVITDVGNYFFNICRIAPNFGGLVPFGKAEFAMVIACFGDMPVDDDEFFDIHKFSSQVCGEWLGDDDAGLDEERAKVMVVFAFEHLEGVPIAWCYRDNQRLTASWSLVL